MKLLKLNFLLSNFVYLMFFGFLNVKAQNFKLTTKSAEIVGDKIIVKYDFTSFKKNQIFSIWLEVKSSSGKKINIYSVKGDVGTNIEGGKNKEVSWYFMEDKILIDDEIEIEIVAKLSDSDDTNQFKKTSNTISPVKTLLFSSIIPGMGITKVKSKKSYILLGLATYGTLATSLVYDFKSLENHALYLNEDVVSSDSEYYKKSMSQKSTSNVLLISAISTWTINMIWTATATSKYNKSDNSSAFNNRIKFNVGLNPIFKTTNLTLVYNINK